MPLSDEELNAVKVIVAIDEKLGATVTFRVAGQALTKSFGPGPVAVERARSLAARIAVLTDEIVIDRIPKKYEILQRSDYNPS